MISILFIDDCVSLMEITSRSLERGGNIIVDMAQTVEEASQKIDYIAYKVIITDYHKKEGDIMKLLSDMRERGLMTPFIFFVASREEQIEAEAVKYGFVYFVPRLKDFESNLPDIEKIILQVGFDSSAPAAICGQC